MNESTDVPMLTFRLGKSANASIASISSYMDDEMKPKVIGMLLKIPCDVTVPCINRETIL